MKSQLLRVGLSGWMAVVAWVALAGNVQAQSEPRAVPVEPDAAPAAPIVIEPENGVVTSRTKQFRISGGTAFGRGLCAILAENAKEELLRILEQPDAWKVPINVVLHGEPGDEVPPDAFLRRHWVVEGVHVMRLHMHLSQGLPVERFKREITEFLLIEHCLKALPQFEEGIKLSIPPWLSVGLREASAWRMQQSDRRLYAAMFNGEGTFKVEDLLGVSRGDHAAFDEASELAFRVSAGALVLALLDQPEGRQAFTKFLNDAASFEGEMALLLRRHFPGLNLSPNSLAKWWALQLANQGGLQLLTDVMTVHETEDQLAKALYLDLPVDPKAEKPGPSRVGLDQWRQLEELDAKQRAAAVRPAQAALVHLSYRCFPSYRPLLIEYQKQLIRLGQGDDKAVAPALAQLERARVIIQSKAERGSHYLNWFEITRAPDTSGVFDDYLKLKQQLKKRDSGREDGMTLYLDRMDELFDRSDEQ